MSHDFSLLLIVATPAFNVYININSLANIFEKKSKK